MDKVPLPTANPHNLKRDTNHLNPANLNPASNLNTASHLNTANNPSPGTVNNSHRRDMANPRPVNHNMANNSNTVNHNTAKILVPARDNPDNPENPKRKTAAYSPVPFLALSSVEWAARCRVMVAVRVRPLVLLLAGLLGTMRRSTGRSSISTAKGASMKMTMKMKMMNKLLDVCSFLWRF
jgi:hypothetical protein